MMFDLIQLFEKMQKVKRSMVLTIAYDCVADWCIEFAWRDKNIELFTQDASLAIASLEMIEKLINLCDEYEELWDIPRNTL